MPATIDPLPAIGDETHTEIVRAEPTIGSDEHAAIVGNATDARRHKFAAITGLAIAQDTDGAIARWRSILGSHRRLPRTSPSRWRWRKRTRWREKAKKEAGRRKKDEGEGKRTGGKRPGVGGS
jgi:hypothetical protein